MTDETTPQRDDVPADDLVADEPVELPDREAMSVITGGFSGPVYPDPDLILPTGDERVSDPGMNK